MIRTMTRSAAMAALLTLVGVATASAHVELISSSPAAGVNLSTPPTEVTITFDDELDPELSSFTVTGPGPIEVGAGQVDLTVADRNMLGGPVTVTDPGVYIVTYSAAGVDGHQLHGSFAFGYQATTPIPDPTSDEHPDTALALPNQHSPLPLVGSLLVAGATVVFLRRLEAN